MCPSAVTRFKVWERLNEACDRVVRTFDRFEDAQDIPTVRLIPPLLAR